MILSMYSFAPFPIHMRSEFELPAFPYNEKWRYKFDDYLKELLVFRYEDNELSVYGKDVSASINYPVKAIDYPFRAYYNEVAISNDELKVIDWPADKQAGMQLLAKLDANPTQMDRKAWFSWNVPYDITEWTQSIISRRSVEEETDTKCGETGCDLVNYKKE